MKNNFILLIGSLMLLLVSNSSCNFNSNAKPNNIVDSLGKDTVLQPTLYNLHTPTINLLSTKDSTPIAIGLYLDKLNDDDVFYVYTKRNKFYLSSYSISVDNKLYFKYKEINYKRKIFGNYFLSSYTDSTYFRGAFGITKKDSQLIWFSHDTSYAEPLRKLKYLNQYIDEKRHYLTTCQKNDSNTLYRFNVVGAWANVFRLHKTDGKYYLQRYNRKEVLQNTELIRAKPPMDERFDYADERWRKKTEEYFLLRKKDTMLFFVDAKNNVPFDSGYYYKKKWKYDWSSVDSQYYSH